MGTCLSCLNNDDTGMEYAKVPFNEEEEEDRSSLTYNNNTNNMNNTYKAPIYRSKSTENFELDHTSAILIAASYCSESPLYAWQEEPLLHINARQSLKACFLVRNRIIPGHELTFDAFANLLCGIESPYIMPTEDVDYHKEKQYLLIFRDYIERGSLRDYIHNKQKPKNSYSIKYNIKGNGLNEKKIKKWGRQILEGLATLRSKGYIFDCLHSGNVLIHNGIAKITDYENSLIGYTLPMNIENLVIPCLSNADIDVILFGLILYEMTYGEEMKSLDSHIKNNDSKHPKSLAIIQILDLIFLSNNNNDDDEFGEEISKLTVYDLIEHPFFSDVKISDTTNTDKIRFDSQGKNVLKISMSSLTRRWMDLYEEYKDNDDSNNNNININNNNNDNNEEKEKENNHHNHNHNHKHNHKHKHKYNNENNNKKKISSLSVINPSGSFNGHLTPPEQESYIDELNKSTTVVNILHDDQNDYDADNDINEFNDDDDDNDDNNNDIFEKENINNKNNEKNNKVIMENNLIDDL